MKEIPLQVRCDLAKVETMSHAKIRLQFITDENIQPSVRAKFMAFHEKYGQLCFLPGEKTIEAEDLLDIPKPVKYEEEGKSPGQKLRAVLWVYWDQNKPTDTFESFYRTQMERFRNSVKEKLT